MILERKEVTTMNFLFYWLVQLTDSLIRLILRLSQIERRLNQLEEEVRALREQCPNGSNL
jgi:CBS domain containing-hemolysin-like protein